VSASEDLFGERQVGTVRVNLGDRILIGAKVESLVPSHRNGWWRLKSGEIEGGRISNPNRKLGSGVLVNRPRALRCGGQDHISMRYFLFNQI
jgi:hypothetical protein